jgi:hypothetical protein
VAFFFAVANNEMGIFLVSIGVILLLGCLLYSPLVPVKAQSGWVEKGKKGEEKMTPTSLGLHESFLGE